ncbi:MAG: ATP-binding cassette domain-containing protein [Candidatus Hydrogenedens sp.]|jgi:putative ABC transport system ATP-binding protein|nr:ATP-binding cassette domain-containing protein [Candidatus Hydrogenedens sp.]
MKPQPLIFIQNMDCIITGQRIFEKLNFSLEAGEKCTLAGASGSGKSTLLKMILGFVPAPPGTLFINGVEVTAKSCWHIRQEMAYVSQEPEIGTGPVRDFLARPFAFSANLCHHFDQEEGESLFETFLLPADTWNKDLSMLSGGEKQRVALVAALLLKRKLLLLDEVASALDTESKEAVRRYLAAQNDTAILSVSHDTEDFTLSSRVVWMEELTGENAHAHR